MYVYIVNLSSSVDVDPTEGFGLFLLFFFFVVVLLGCDRSCCLLSALELVNERCRVSDSEKKKEKNLQHLNVHVHSTVHEMLAYCVTYFVVAI